MTPQVTTMSPVEHGVSRWHRFGYGPALTLAAMALLVAFAVARPFAGWTGKAASVTSIVVALALLQVFVRQGEHRGATRNRRLVVGFAVFLATDAIVFLLQKLWSTPS